jgi:PAS domain S-box-containing protein
MLTRIRARAEDVPPGDRAHRESRANFRTLAETIASAIFISRGKCLSYVNHAAEVITGYTREELFSVDFWDLVHPDSRELVMNRGRVRQGENGAASRYEVRILTKNHEERWLDITATTIDFDGGRARLVSASTSPSANGWKSRHKSWP